jgi:hypothetical protein
MIAFQDNAIAEVYRERKVDVLAIVDAERTSWRS